MDEQEYTKRLNWYEKRYGPYIEKRGFTKENVKNLFRWPTLQEWIIFIMMLMALFLGWAYQHDVKAYREALTECQLYGYIPQVQGSINYSLGIGEKANDSYFVWLSLSRLTSRS